MEEFVKGALRNKADDKGSTTIIKIKRKDVCHHELMESNILKTRGIYYSEVICTKCNNEFEHVIAYGPCSGTISKWTSELRKKE